VPQSFHVGFAVQSKVPVRVTWGQPSSLHTAYILKNQHRIQLVDAVHLICANHLEVSRYDNLMKAYCEGLCTVLAAALLYTPHEELAATGSHITIDDDSKLSNPIFQQDWPQCIPRIASYLPDSFIRLEDLVCIQHMAWFNSNLINEYMHALQKSFPDVHIFKDYYEVGYLDSFKLNETHKKFSGFMKTITEASVVVFIFNLDGLHWIAARICKRTASVCVMDSLLNPNESLIANLRFIARKCWKINLSLHRSKVPHQENSCDCGPLACLFALFLAQTAADLYPKPIALTYNTKSTAREMRIRILADLYAGRITMLQT
jgi:hypothetical protein